MSIEMYFFDCLEVEREMQELDEALKDETKIRAQDDKDIKYDDDNDDDDDADDDDGDDDDDDDDDEPDLRIINTWLNCINVVQPPLFSMNWNKSARFSY